jgi:hypothetical protein
MDRRHWFEFVADCTNEGGIADITLPERAGFPRRPQIAVDETVDNDRAISGTL